MKRRPVARAVVTVLAAGGALLAAATPAVAAPGTPSLPLAPTSCGRTPSGAFDCRTGFGAVGQPQRWTVPGDVTRLSVFVAGGSALANATYPNSPGRGGLVRVSFAVTPGSTITVVVGQQGQFGSAYGGGTDGGGGGSFLFRGRALTVAVGGGGGAGLLYGPPASGFAQPLRGGNGGAGAAGSDGATAPRTGATTTTPGYCPERTRPVCGDGNGPTRTPTSLATGGRGGGGGGGGYYAGGGNVNDGADGGGIIGPGGGGSGYLAPDVTLADAGTNTGAGRIVLSWTQPTP